MAYNPKDFYFKKAKEQNFAARSVFKLEEIDQRFRLFRPGMRFLDLGCAPGSWSQYASAKIGKAGVGIGIDLQRVTLALPNVRFEQGDAFDEALISRLAGEVGADRFDVVLSDMAPKTTGVRITDQERSFDLCCRALDVAERWLKPGGHFVAKLFQSDRFDQFLGLVKKSFSRIEIVRPKSTRKSSFEVFIVGMNYKGKA